MIFTKKRLSNIINYRKRKIKAKTINIILKGEVVFYECNGTSIKNIKP